ncbi:MAG TPA: DeoR/GlpR family DNA-binding transcription regulator [Terrimicrobiaceae bacterium]
MKDNREANHSPLSVSSVDVSERAHSIMESFRADGSVKTSELAKEFSVSEMTIRRDLDELVRLGLARRVHGGAVLLTVPEEKALPVNDSSKMKLVARKALEFFPQQGTVYLDAGRTSMELARVILDLPRAQRDALRIVTHASNVASYLSEVRAVRSVHQIGDDIDQVTLAAVGPQALEQLQGLHYNVFFMGVSGADPEAGWTNNNLAESKVKQVVMKHAAKVYVIADSSKWRVVNFAPIGPFDAALAWITDRGREAEIRPFFSRLKCDLIFAE